MKAAILGLLAGLAPPVELPLYLGAPVPPAALERALEEADRLFAPGGIRFDWRFVDEEPDHRSRAVVVVRPRPSEPVISGCSRNLHDHRLGVTHLPSRRVTIWTEQVARAVAGSWGRKQPPRVDDSSLGTALGRVLAHELGHLFLLLNGHRESGLMKPAFSQRALIGRSGRAFRLSAADLERVREAISAQETPRN